MKRSLIAVAIGTLFAAPAFADYETGLKPNEIHPGVTYGQMDVTATKAPGARKSRTEVKSLRQKLFREAWLSVQTAMEIEPHTPDHTPIVVHLDVNPDKRWASSRHINEVVGLVMGQGFEVLYKPDAWAASHTADHVVKNKHHALL